MSTTTLMSTSTPATAAPPPIADVAASRWRIDPLRSSIAFRTRTLWGRATVEGQFARYGGTLDLRRTPAVELTIEADSLNTNNRFRDRHLRSADFFDVAVHPEVRFVSDRVSLDGERLWVRGRLSAAGRTMPLELEARLRRVGDELEVEATTGADHRELGMTHSTLGMIRTPSELILRGRLVAEAD
jgi:polyisoprenoid-binding protein YceI